MRFVLLLNSKSFTALFTAEVVYYCKEVAEGWLCSSKHGCYVVYLYFPKSQLLYGTPQVLIFKMFTNNVFILETDVHGNAINCVFFSLEICVCLFSVWKQSLKRFKTAHKHMTMHVHIMHVDILFSVTLQHLSQLSIHTYIDATNIRHVILIWVSRSPDATAATLTRSSRLTLTNTGTQDADCTSPPLLILFYLCYFWYL